MKEKKWKTHRSTLIILKQRSQTNQYIKAHDDQAYHIHCMDMDMDMDFETEKCNKTHLKRNRIHLKLKAKQKWQEKSASPTTGSVFFFRFNLFFYLFFSCRFCAFSTTTELNQRAKMHMRPYNNILLPLSVINVASLAWPFNFLIIHLYGAFLMMLWPLLLIRSFSYMSAVACVRILSGYA